MPSHFSSVRKHNIHLWHRWFKIQQRCHQNHEHYEDIKICPEWDMEVSGPELAFLNFWEDMGDDFDETLMIDRIDPNGHYEPHNCRWVDAKVSGNNKRFHHTDYGRGLTRAKKLWGDNQITRIRYWRRVKKGWSFKDAAEISPNPGNRMGKKPKKSKKSRIAKIFGIFSPKKSRK